MVLRGVPDSGRAAVGEPVGSNVGESVGFGVGEPDGELVGFFEGLIDGDEVGVEEASRCPGNSISANRNQDVDESLKPVNSIL